MVDAKVSGTRYASFLLRMWRENAQDSASPDGIWQGEAQHIQTGQRWTFDSLDELLSLLHRQLEGPGPAERG